MWDICYKGGQRKYRRWKVKVRLEKLSSALFLAQLFIKCLVIHPLCLSRVNDWLLKINDIDLTNKDRKQVVKAVLNGGGLINMVVRRRKSLGGRLVTPVHINLVGHKGAPGCYII